MTCGIYVLYYETDDFQYYIGKSIDIEGRYKEHCRKLKNGYHKNILLKSGYDTFNTFPTLSVLEELSADDNILYLKEIEWIEEFNSFHHGMNETVGGGGTGFGEDSPRSKYSNSKIIEVFNLIVNDRTSSLKSISSITGVSYAVVKTISEGSKHRWLQDMFPEKYIIMLNMIGTRSKSKSAKDRGIIYPAIVDPEGKIYHIDNAAEFSKIHGLHKASLYNVLNGKAYIHKGWKLLKAITIKTYTLISPEGIQHTISTNEVKNFAEANNLRYNDLQNVLNKKANSHKGWKLYKGDSS